MILEMVCYSCGQVLTIFETRFRELLKQGLPCYAVFREIHKETGHILPLAVCDKRMLTGFTDYSAVILLRHELSQLSF